MEFKLESDIEDKEINEKDKNLRNISYSKRDVYYRKAKEEGFRARSVYKLKEINDNYKILENADKIIDLCAAPGSWSQMLRLLTKNNKNAKIVSVDLQDIVPIEGVITVKGDITKQETIEQILSHFNNEKVDVVIFDGAPDVTGVLDIDLYMQVQLIVFSLLICIKVLKNNGKFVAKIFKESDTNSDYYYDKCKTLFNNIYFFKPGSSRNTSHENYIICEGFGINDEEIKEQLVKLKIEDIFKLEEIENQKTKKFLSFLCNENYNYN